MSPSPAEREGHEGRKSLRPENLRSMTELRRLAGRNWTKADILVYRWGTVDVALKDYRRRGFLVRHTLGRWLVRRETAAFRAAGDVGGLPRFLGRVGAFALATEWLEATPLAAWPVEALRREWPDRLQAIVEQLHARGVALGDLHHRDVLITPDQDVYVIDLATALVRGERPGPIRRALFERWREQDLVAMARLRARFTGGDVVAAPASVGPGAAAWHRRGRRIKSLLDRLRRRHR